MRTLFVICTAVTILQVFDVSITEISAAKIQFQPQVQFINPNSNEGTVKPVELKSRITVRSVKNSNAAPENKKPTNFVTSYETDNSEPGTNPNNVDSEEGEPPKTIKESGRRVVKTAKNIANRRGAGFLNGVTGLMKKANNTFDFFGKFIRDRSNNVKDVAKESFGLVSGFSDSSTNGAKNLIGSARVIGNQGAQVMYSTLQKSTSLGKNLTKLGGTVIDTPISIADDVVITTNDIAKIPSRLSKKITKDGLNPLLSFGSDSDENKSEKEDEEVNNKKSPSLIKVPSTPPSTRKLINKKPTP